MRKRLVCVTDIPTPYRVHLFEALNRELQSRGIAFEVIFMETTVPMRFWKVDLSRATFSYKIAAGWHPRYNGSTYHFNPGTLWSLLKHPPTWLVIGGGWQVPTGFSLAFTMAMRPRRSYTILWAEANSGSMMFKTGLIALFRRVVMQAVDAFAVPGRIARQTIIDLCGVRGKDFLPLPNLVDEEVYGEKAQIMRGRKCELRKKRGLKGTDLVLLWPARLSERDKGVVNFLEAVKPLITEQVKILIAGEGPDRNHIEKWLSVSDLKGVRLLGQQSNDEMLELFAIADVLLLPSLADPNPLSVIEALWAGLPIFISNRCGNWPEAFEENRNGWVIDPSSVKSMQSSFIDLLNKSREQLTEFGLVSMALAKRRFATESCARAFVEALRP